MCAASWPSTVRISRSSSALTVPELSTTIGRCDPTAIALMNGIWARYSSGTSWMSSRASAARCSCHTVGSCSSPSRTALASSSCWNAPLVAVLDQLPHDRVHHRDRLQRRGRGPVRGMLVGLRRDVDEALVVGERRRSYENQGRRSLTRITSLQAAPNFVHRRHLDVHEPVRERDLAHHVLGQVGRLLGGLLRPRDPQRRRSAPSARAAPASASRGRAARCGS